MLSAEEIGANYERFRSLCEKLGDRSEPMMKLIDHFSERLAMCPASSKKAYHCAYPGGLLEHSLHVLGTAMRLCKTFGWEVPKDTLILTCLAHDLGKLGNLEEAYYVDADQWQKDKLGDMYKYNKNIQYVSVPHQSLWLLQHFGVKLFQDEFLAILLHDGQHAKQNESYSMQEPALASIVSTADFLATKQEKGVLAK